MCVTVVGLTWNCIYTRLLAIAVAVVVACVAIVFGSVGLPVENVTVKLPRRSGQMNTISIALDPSPPHVSMGLCPV